MPESAEILKKVLEYLEDHGTYVDVSKVEIVRGTKKGFNLYTSNWKMIVTFDPPRMLIRSPLEEQSTTTKKESTEEKKWWEK